MALSDLNLPPITFHKAAHYTQGRTEPVRAFVNHRMVGTVAGTTAYFANPATRPVSTHFGIGKISGKIVIHQYVPLDDTAFGNGNYDASGVWDDWGYKITEINPQTISIEHQDHWGDDSLKGIVPDDVQQASMKLQALIRYGTIAQWKAAGLTFRDWKNATIIKAEVGKIPVDGRHIIRHKDIAGNLKPYCWAPWQKDTVGFPRAKYVAGIKTYGASVTYVAPPPTPEPPPPPVTYTQTEVDAMIAQATADLTSRNTTLAAEKASLVTALGLANDLASKLNIKIQEIRAITDRPI